MKALLTLFFISWLTTCFGQSDTIRKKHYNTKKDIAVEGYDVVSYFDGEPKEGESEYSIVYKGITYFFASKSTFEKFKMDPVKYEPAYGGWCAYAMGETGEKVKVDAETFKIIDGKLYLFYNFWGNNTLGNWNKNEKALRSAGDKNWKKFIP
jgi:YHS domain-containing protein